MKDSMSKKDCILEAVRERDIDMLLLEEWNVNPEFNAWFIHTITGHSPVILSAKGWHSTYDEGHGETDLRFEVQTEDHRYLFLVEDKIDAEAQENQGHRYKKRADYHNDTNAYSMVKTCIVAPEHYLNNNAEVKEYDHSISYEDICAFFREYTNNRMDYKAHVFQSAINQERRGYQAIRDDVVTNFMRSYWLYIKNNYAGLIMKEPTIVPSRSDWPVLKLVWLPEKWKIRHKLSNGSLDLETTIRSESVDDLITSLAQHAVTVVKTGKSISIRIAVPKIVKTDDFNSQISLLDEACKKIQIFTDIKEILLPFNKTN